MTNPSKCKNWRPRITMDAATRRLARGLARLDGRSLAEYLGALVASEWVRRHPAADLAAKDASEPLGLN